MSRNRAIAYWVCTLLVGVNVLVAGVVYILRPPMLLDILLRLGYPPYFAVFLGVWKVLAAVGLLAPRTPLLKEWAYAGLFFNFSAAIVAHAAVRDDAVTFVGPILAIGALVVSWTLRPASRRLELRTAEATA